MIDCKINTIATYYNRRPIAVQPRHKIIKTFNQPPGTYTRKPFRQRRRIEILIPKMRLTSHACINLGRG